MMREMRKLYLKYFECGYIGHSFRIGVNANQQTDLRNNIIRDHSSICLNHE